MSHFVSLCLFPPTINRQSHALSRLPVFADPHKAGFVQVRCPFPTGRSLLSQVALSNVSAQGDSPGRQCVSLSLCFHSWLPLEPSHHWLREFANTQKSALPQSLQGLPVTFGINLSGWAHKEAQRQLTLRTDNTPRRYRHAARFSIRDCEVQGSVLGIERDELGSCV